MHVVFQLSISPDTLQEASELANARGIPLNELIVIAVESHLVSEFRATLVAGVTNVNSK